MASEVAIAGSVSVGPASPAGPGALDEFLSLDARATYASVVSGSIDLAGSFAIPFGTIRALALRSVDGVQLLVSVTSAAGAAQVVPLSGTWFQSWPKGTPVDAVTVTGTGRLEYLVAGG